MAVFGWHGLHYNGAVPFAWVPNFFPVSFFEEGHTGVALFLTLSGFILAAICTGREVMYGAFIRNRLLRLLPLLLIWTLAWFYTSNVAPERLFAMFFGLLVNGGQFPGAGWTVIIEFQFYLVFPFLLLFVERYGLRYLFGIVAIAFFIRLLFFLRVGNVQVLAYSTAFGRIDQFALGMAAFHVYRRGHIPRSPWFLLALVSLWLFIFHQFNRLGGYWYPTHREIWVYFPTLEGLFYGLITATYLRTSFAIPRVLNVPAAWLGKISYSLYLNHDAVMTATAQCAVRLDSRTTTRRPLWSSHS